MVCKTNGGDQHGSGGVLNEFKMFGAMVIAFISILAACMGPVISIGNRQRDDFDKLSDRYFQDLREDSYRAGAVDTELKALNRQVAANTEEAKALDSRLQREMRDVNATTEAKLVSLDTRLQSELSTAARILQSAIDRTEKALAGQEEQQNENRESITSIWEKVRAIERQQPQPFFDAAATEKK